ncbi:uncharacterized protein LOC128163344 [Crassostrea angulata]|uniref:uncharacterized protein LOC128163344 n=1 Tax=Magallana angulata TaxID=2784310 RepID=UPI0022B1C709|nr:uncharacterized protein LOC128163344 [Crassostrea angulata]
MREGRKQLYTIQQQYAERNIDTRIKEDKLVFTQSNSVYRDKLGPRPIDDEIITREEVKKCSVQATPITISGTASPVTPPPPYRLSRSNDYWSKTGMSTKCYPYVFANRLEGPYGAINEGSNDDGDHGAS